MAKLLLLRHLKSQWNEDNRFAGWVDNPLAKGEDLDSKTKEQLTGIETIYTSPLIRNMETVLKVFEILPEKYPLFLHLDGGKMQRWANFKNEGSYAPVFVSENLNERYYGKLQGLNKEEIAKQYGGEKVRLWRRGFLEKPPGGESLMEVYKRAVPFFKKYAEKDLAGGKNVLVVASHNSLRALVKYIENVSDEDIANLELPFGALVKYEFDGKFAKLH